MQEPAYFPDMV
uniref:Oocyte specific homeobox 8 n=1 Tax=Mus musculus TaxID=10090 RepID=A0AA74KUL7_MOUSE